LINTSSIKSNANSRTTIQIRERIRANEASATKVALAMPAHINYKAQRIDAPIFLYYLHLPLQAIESNRGQSELEEKLFVAQGIGRLNRRRLRCRIDGRQQGKHQHTRRDVGYIK